MMLLQWPVALSFLAAIPVVVLLYFLRRRAREAPVSALFLWERLPRGEVARLERLWPRVDVLLVLQLVIVVLFALAAAGPTLVRVRPAGATLVIMDASAPMSAGDLAEQARDAARRAIREAAGPWAVVAWTTPVEVLCPPTSQREEALAAVGRYRPGLARRPPLGEALAPFPRGWDRVVVISYDPPSGQGLEVVPLPFPANYALRAFSVRPQPDGSGYEVLARVANDTDSYADLFLTIRAGDTEYMKSLLVVPGEEEVFVLPYQGPVVQGLVAELSPQDDFPWDNVRYFATGTGEVRVRWVGEDDPYLLAALRAAAPVVLAGDPPWDLTVALRAELDTDPAGPALLVDSGTPEAPLGERLPAGEWRAEDDPLISHLRPWEWRAEAVLEARLPAGAKVALWSGEIPALARWETSRGRRVLLALDLSGTDLPLSMDFPILVRNALVWLLPWQEGEEHYVGEAVALPPGARVVTEAGEVSGIWVPDAPGLYRVQGGGREWWIAVNLPPEEPGASSPPVEASAAPAQENRPLWPLVSWLALGLLVLEGVLAVRRG